MPSIAASCCEPVGENQTLPQPPSAGSGAGPSGNRPLVDSPSSASPLSDSQGYDLVVQQLIPGYASLARLSVALLAASPRAGREGASVLVAGCGTGAELVEARAQRPDWRITAIDPSLAMLEAAQRRLGDAGIQWQQARVEDLRAEACYAGALSVLVLQSLPDDGTKLAFLTALARSLEPGGQLVLVDLMAPERSPLQAQVQAAWLGFQRASGLSEQESREAALGQGLHPIGVARLTALVNAAGFGDPARIFQALGYEGFLLQRPA